MKWLKFVGSLIMIGIAYMLYRDVRRALTTTEVEKQLSEAKVVEKRKQERMDKVLKDAKDMREKIKERLIEGARKWGRPLCFFLVILLSANLCAGYSNWNYMDNTNWEWRSESAYVEYLQFVVTNKDKLLHLRGTEVTTWSNKFYLKDGLVSLQEKYIIQKERENKWYTKLFHYTKWFLLGVGIGYISSR